MADTLGQQDLNGINVQKLVEGFEEEAQIFRNFLTVTPTSNREIRWFQKTDGSPLDSTDTTGITASQVVSAFGTLPAVAEDSVTRKQSYVRHYSLETPWFTYADLKDSDPDMLGLNIKNVTRGVKKQQDMRILDVLSGTCLLSGSATADWGASTAKAIGDLLSGSTEIEKHSYNVSNIVNFMHPTQKMQLLTYIIDTAGSSIPNFSSDKVKDGVLMSIAGQKIVSTNNATEGQVLQIIPKTVATWKVFTPLQAVVKEEPGIGKKVRVWEDGEIIVTDPYAVHLIKGA